MPETTTRITELAAKYQHRINPGVRDDYMSSADAMAELLAEWSPLGSSVDTLSMIVGQPPEEHSDGMYYFFESGLDGVAWQVWSEQGIIIGILRKRID